MRKLTYKEAYDKLITAYFKDDIKPYHADFCFCGTLSSGVKEYYRQGKHGWNLELYSNEEYFDMEDSLLMTISREMSSFIPRMSHNKYACVPEEGGTDILREQLVNHPEYENAIFSGFCKALEVLKQIHTKRGEVIEELPKLTQRVLQ